MKKKGSALVFSVLMLAFFLALSLNIFFLARKKAERTSIKVQGEVVTNNIDIASSLGYQELKLAEEFVRLGFTYIDGHPSVSSPNTSYSTTSDGSHLYLNLSDGTFDKRYAGIQLNNFIDYFSSEWKHNNSLNQKLIIGEEISGGKTINRMWQSSGIDATLTPLWNSTTTNPVSVGGYKVSTSPDFTKDIDTGTDGNQAIAAYEKFVYLPPFSKEDPDGEETISVETSVFNIKVYEKFTYTIDGSDISISNRNVTDFIISAVD